MTQINWWKLSGILAHHRELVTIIDYNQSLNNDLESHMLSKIWQKKEMYYLQQWGKH
jgi:hypothetical protein